MPNYKIGFTDCYIEDHKFTMISEIPAIAAMEWAKHNCPEIGMGCGKQAKDLTIDENSGSVRNWLNKMFIIVNHKFTGQYIAIYKANFKFYLYISYE